MAIRETFLGAFLQVSLDRLASTKLLEFARKALGIDTMMLKKWRRKLPMIQAALADAEDKEISNPAVKSWLHEVRHLAYDLDDLLDEIATQAASTSRAWDFQSKIEKIKEQLEEIMDLKNDLGLVQTVGTWYGTIYSSSSSSEPLPATSLFDKFSIRGREEDKEAIVQRVLSCDQDCSSNQFGVIPIVGMGGLGKTTLAQLVYNDETVKSAFELRAWAYVSQDLDIQSLTKSILQALNFPGNCEGKNLNWLQEKLKETLSGKKFLIVLDDVWNENYKKWDVFCNPFRNGVSGCKMIVTTRNAGVASIMGVSSPYHLQSLPVNDCLSLFAYHVWGTTSNFDAHPDLKDIGTQIVSKCDGLPLAIKTLGGLLRTKNVVEWTNILESNTWDLPEENNDILPALRLSYHHLPSPLKQCFAYCSLFPKGYEFDKDELVQLWMAEGFLQQQQQQQGNNTIEDVGCEYFSELLSRSFFQPSSGDESIFVMHDLINDLARFVARDVYFHLENKLETSRPDDFYFMVSFPPFIPDADDDYVLPSSITVLIIRDLENLESLSEGLLKLTSLQYLGIYNCPKLKSLPTPSEGSQQLLPPTIQSLWIWNCPLLEECCKKRDIDTDTDTGGGDYYWPLIAHIPDVDLSGTKIT